MCRLNSTETNTPILLQGSLGIPVPTQPWLREMGIWALCHICISEHLIQSSPLPQWTQSQGVGEIAINSIIRQLTRNRKIAWRLFQPSARILEIGLWMPWQISQSPSEPGPHSCFETTKYSHSRADLLGTTGQDSELCGAMASHMIYLWVHGAVCAKQRLGERKELIAL